MSRYGPSRGGLKCGSWPALPPGVLRPIDHFERTGPDSLYLKVHGCRAVVVHSAGSWQWTTFDATGRAFDGRRGSDLDAERACVEALAVLTPGGD